MAGTQEKHPTRRAHKKPPGPLALPLVGAVYTFRENPLDLAMRQYHRYGEVVGINLLGIHGATLHGADANRYILVDAADNFVVAPLIEKVHARWIVGEGLAFIDGARHDSDRKLALPAFHREQIEKYRAVVTRSTAETLDTWRPGNTMDVAQEIKRLALVIVGRALFNIELGGDANDLRAAVSIVVETASNFLLIAMAQLPLDVGRIGKGATLRRSLATIDATLYRLIRDREDGGKDDGDAVSLLVAARYEGGDRLTAQQIRDHLLTLFVAGYETTASTLAWAFYLLAQHPRVASRLLEELGRELAGKAPAIANLERLPYLDQVVKEVLRLYPPIPSNNRVALRGFIWKGYTIRPGDTVVYSSFITHRMTAYWPEPEVFRPERFDPVQGDHIPLYAYIPFGAGPRSCIGEPFAVMAIKTVLTMILQRYRLDLVPDQYVEAIVRTTTQPKDGILMRPYPQDGLVENSPARITGNVVGAVGN